ncbi:MAG: coproporphyrinogen-III oxidase family protein [Candidatus Limnocylindrales bacterium]
MNAAERDVDGAAQSGPGPGRTPAGGHPAAPDDQPPRPGSPVALYVHIPFCVSLCPYCDFVVLSGAAARGPRARVRAFMAALGVELELRADVLDERFGAPGSVDRPALGSVYLGGGTPSLLPPGDVARLLERIESRFRLAADVEVTLEANPGPDERGDLAACAAAGVTRVSFGGQSFDAGELRRLGRRHAPGDVAAAVAEARRAGIGSVNLDLLYDVPGQSARTWAASLMDALALEPDHLSLYALTLDDPDAEGLTGTLGDHLPTRPGARRWRKRARAEQDDDRAAAAYEEAWAVLSRRGWRGYELSNWARPGHESRHNLAYWERRTYEALGPGAHAFDGARRRWNSARLEGYLAALSPTAGAPRLPPGGEEALDAATAAAEAVVLGLRLDRGIPATSAAVPRFSAALAWALEAGLLERWTDAAHAERLRLTLRGRLLSNELFARLV